MRLFLMGMGAALGLMLSACGGSNAPEAAAENPPAGEALTLEGAADPDPVTEDVASMAGSVNDRFAQLALDCIHKPYPNKISHVMTSDEDIQSPREMTPAFYGCFDWHSSVHGHWLLVRILKTDPDTTLAPRIREALAESFTEENLAAELDYYMAPDRAGFERPYGIAWYLQLVAELDGSQDPQLRQWRETLRPLEDAIVARVEDWLPKLAYPIRLGTHNQSAFAFGLMLDYARASGNYGLESLLVSKARGFHMEDVNCPMAYEPSGEDFLSPCLMEADLMRRVTTRAEFADWLSAFLPDIPTDGSADWIEPGVVLDASDGKLVHLDGLNLSRAWALEGIAAGLPSGDARHAALMAASEAHAETGLAAVSAEHYSGSHWLASFAIYLKTQRGITGAGAPQ